MTDTYLFRTARNVAFALPLLSLACGEPTVHAGSVDGGEAPASYVVSQEGGVVTSDGLGTDPNGGEGPGVAPTCTAVDPATVVASEMANVPAGAFTMGCDPRDTECREDEKPPHSVTLKTFDMDKTEVTTSQYLMCVQAGKCTYAKCPWDPCSRPKHPISCLTHEQAEAYCAYVGKRLPTEAEWEKAARGTDGRKFPWGQDAPTCARANILDCKKDLEPVGAHPDNASPYGVLDLAGNVVEWVKDYYDEAYYASSAPTDPVGPANGTHYVGRGGGFLSEPVWHRAGSRDGYPPVYTRVSLGVRCVK